MDFLLGFREALATGVPLQPRFTLSLTTAYHNGYTHRYNSPADENSLTQIQCAGHP